jgi:hypothetical protein
MPSKPFLFHAALAVACLFAGSTGCRTAAVPDSLLPTFGGNDATAQLDYWHELAVKPLISNDEALHGLLLYLDDADAATSYDQRVTTLKSRHLLPANFNQPADQALTRGTLAVPIAKILNYKGGLTVHLTGFSPRYATRELEYRGVYPPSSENQIFTGAEFVGVIGKVQDERAGDPTNQPAAVVPAQANAAEEEKEISPIFAIIQAPVPGDLALRPSPATTQAGPMKVVITAVTGIASVRENETAPWKPATKGMELGEQAEFRTGPKGTIQFTIAPDQTVSIDRLTTMKVLKLLQSGGKVQTDLGIKYGRTRYDLEGGGIEHQSTLRSPNATLAVRGTKVSLFDQPPYAPQAVSLTGRAEFAALRKRTIAFGNRGQGKTIVTSASETASDVALSQTVVDPTLQGARTESEAALLTTLISRGATTEIDRQSGIRIVRGGVPPTDAQLVPALPGRLNFVLRWNSDANLDLGVSTPGTGGQPGGEFVFPAAGLNISPSGGKTAFDHRGGPNGGIEVVYFDHFVDGVYAIGGKDVTVGSVTTATIDAFLDGQRLQVFDGLSLSDTVTQTVSPDQPALALVAVNAPLPIVEPPVEPPVLPPDFGQKRVTARTFKSLSEAAVSGRAMGPVPAAAKPQAPRAGAKR